MPVRSTGGSGLPGGTLVTTFNTGLVNEHDIAQSVLCMVGDANYSASAISLNPFVFLCVFE